MNTNPFRSGARTLTVIWAGFWTCFILGAALSDGGGMASKLLVCGIAITFFFSNCALVWLFEEVAGFVLAFEAMVLTAVSYTFLFSTAATSMILLMTLCVPPLVTGIVLLKLKQSSHRPTR